jgi:hypothetical protein
MINCEIDPVRRRVQVIATGMLSVPEIIEALAALKANPAFEPGFDMLADFSGASTAAIKSNRVSELSRHMVFAPHARCAFIVGSSADYGMLRMFQAWSEQKPRDGYIAVFRDLRSALTWLDRPAHNGADCIS